MAAIATVSQIAVFPIPATEAISQDALARIVTIRRQIETLESELLTRESAVRESLDAGAAVETGLFRAYLKTTERRSIEWKSVALRLAERMGLNPSAYASNVLSHTKPTVSTRLVVEA